MLLCSQFGEICVITAIVSEFREIRPSIVNVLNGLNYSSSSTMSNVHTDDIHGWMISIVRFWQNMIWSFCAILELFLNLFFVCAQYLNDLQNLKNEFRYWRVIAGYYQSISSNSTSEEFTRCCCQLVKTSKTNLRIQSTQPIYILHSNCNSLEIISKPLIHGD